jgi:GTPase SAR1 family protein
VILVNKRCRFDLFLSFVNMDPRLVHPFTAIICGPSGSGKTIFTFKLIKEASKMIYPPPEKIVYCYGEFQPIFNEYPEVTFAKVCLILVSLMEVNGLYSSLMIF